MQPYLLLSSRPMFTGRLEPTQHGPTFRNLALLIYLTTPVCSRQPLGFSLSPTLGIQLRSRLVYPYPFPQPTHLHTFHPPHPRTSHPSHPHRRAHYGRRCSQSSPHQKTGKSPTPVNHRGGIPATSLPPPPSHLTCCSRASALGPTDNANSSSNQT